MKTVKVKPPQDCLEDKDLGIYAEETDLDGHTPAVLSYINFSAVNVPGTKAVKVFPNQKPWFNSKVRTLL